jgi:hypothetical protein
MAALLQDGNHCSPAGALTRLLSHNAEFACCDLSDGIFPIS